MKHSIQAGLTFYFKGEKFEPSVQLDVDKYLEMGSDMKYIYDKLAKSLGMNEHRHEYDVMVLEDIHFSAPQGLVVGFCEDGVVDWQGLEEAWHKQAALEHAKAVAKEHFSDEEIKNNPKLIDAFLSAYKKR